MRPNDGRAYAPAVESPADEMLATVVHELRSPLNAIEGWARLIEEGTLSRAQAGRAIATIIRSAAAQRRLIDDLVATMNCRRAELQIRAQRIYVDAVVSCAVAIVRPVADEKQIGLRTRAPDTAIEIWGDLQRLQQVFCNLLINAVKFSPQQSNVCLHVERRERFVALRVRDDGVGIRPEFLPYVFERFRRENRVHRSGLGLGLAIARDIVERHGGTISADSAGEGRGATFTVELPLFGIRSLSSGSAAARVADARPSRSSHAAPEGTRTACRSRAWGR
jgi:signal transduction histidine kinase